MEADAGSLIDRVRLLPCIFRDGTRDDLALAEAFRRCHDIVGIVYEVPTMQPAVLRQVLLPIFLDALGSPATLTEWQQRFTRGRLDDKELDRLGAYFDRWAHRFELFHPQYPFAQVAGLRTEKGETKGAGLLVATEPTGNNVPLFASRTEGDSLPLTVAAAARWLMHAHCWDVAAIKTGVVGDPKAQGGKTSGNPTGPLGSLGVVVPVGTTLYETLLLNTPVGVGDRLGTAQWRREEGDPRWTGGPQWSGDYVPDGLLDLWTLQSRRIRLFPNTTGTETVVDRVIVAAGDRLRDGPPEWEPHTAWRLDKQKKQTAGLPAMRPLRHAPGRPVWQGMRALLALEADSSDVRTSELLDQAAALERMKLLDHQYPLRVEVFGIEYGNQSAVIEDLHHDAMSLPVAALRGQGEAYDLVIEVAAQAEALARAINHLAADLRQALGCDPIPWDKGQRPGEQLLYALDPLVRRLLAGVGADADDSGKLEAGRLAWETLADQATRRTARPLFDVPASAFLGRTVLHGKKERSYKLGSAANSFDSAVDEILPRAAEARTRARADTPRSMRR
ncbi:type I-E CRISPR-associated protein Cse1/CasA [Nocardia gipuzkoensis]